MTNYRLVPVELLKDWHERINTIAAEMAFNVADEMESMLDAAPDVHGESVKLKAFSKGDTYPVGDCGNFVSGIDHNITITNPYQWDHQIEVYGSTPEQAEALRDRVLDALEATAVQGEPVGWQFYQDGRWWYGDDRVKDHRKNTEEAGFRVRDVYAAPQPAERQPDPFRGDNAALIRSAQSLLSLDDKGALSPNGVGGHARNIINALIARISAEQHPAPSERSPSMTTNKPESVPIWRAEDEWNENKEVVRFVDCQDLQADRDQQYDIKIKAQEQRDAVTAKLKALQAECERWKNSANGAHQQLTANRLETEKLAVDWSKAMAKYEKLHKASSELANWCYYEVGADIEITPGLKQVMDITGVVYDEE